MKDLNHGLNAPLIVGDNSRQPHYIFKDRLLEIPSHGWQDNVFTGTSLTKGAEDYPKDIDGIIKHYFSLILEGMHLAGEKKISLS